MSNKFIDRIKVPISLNLIQMIKDTKTISKRQRCVCGDGLSPECLVSLFSVHVCVV